MMRVESNTPSYDALALRATPAGAASDRRQLLQEEIAKALHENIARGYLESEERFQQIADALNDVVALTNEDISKIFFVNAAYERIWGRRREELLAEPLSFLEGVHPDDRARVRDAILGEPRGHFDVEFRVLRPTGDQRWVWARGFPVLDMDGSVYRIATITEDITERKAVAESHDRLLRGFTHDVKNPLGVADGFLALLEMGVSGEMGETQKDHVARARRAIRTALGLVTQLLEIERAREGELIVARERVDLGTVVTDGVEDYRVAAADKKLAVTSRIIRTDDDLVMETDRARVRQIFANLLSNAIKYTQPGGSILVSARAGDGEADEAPRRGRWVVLTVADTGPGIPAEKQGLLFREFTRFSPDTAEGSGIGLAISQNLAHALGGAITFQSILGVGSTFSLWLPRPLPIVDESAARQPQREA